MNLETEHCPDARFAFEPLVSLPPTRDRAEIIRRMRMMCGNAANQMGLFGVDWDRMERHIAEAVDKRLEG